MVEEIMLAVLAKSPGGLHGLGIKEAVETQSGGLYQLASGTIYPALNRLLKKKYVTDRWEDLATAAAAARPRRRYMEITELGREALVEAAKLHRIRSIFLLTVSIPKDPSSD